MTLPKTNYRSIALSLFSNCTSLKEVSIPTTVISIEDYAFKNCSSLVTASIPTSVTKIGNYAFHSCSKLKEAKGEHVESIGSYAFFDCKEMATAYFPSVKTLGTSSFDGCTSLTSLTLTNLLTKIPESCFRNCSSLPSISLYEQLATIGKSAFNGCSNLKDLTLPKTVTFIGTDAFSDCTRLQDLTYAAGTKTILRTYATYIEHVVIPESADSIVNHAFDGCGVLEEVYLPGKILKVEPETFKDCVTLKKLTYGEGLKNIYRAYITSLTSVSMPSTSKAVNSDAFLNCEHLTEVEVPEGVTSIGWSAFEGCSLLADVKLPESLSYINKGAFRGCGSLAKIYLPAGVTYVYSDTFSGCTKLTNLTYGEGLKSVYPIYCTSLIDVTMPSTATAIQNETFIDCAEMTSVKIPDGVVSIGASAFQGCERLNNVVLPPALTSLGIDAFSGCKTLTDLTYSNGIKTAFRTYATELTSVTIPSSIREFADNAFSACDKLTKINISNIEMWNYIFKDVTKDPFACPHVLYFDGKPMTELIADFGRPVYNYAFSQVKELKGVTLCHSITYVGKYAFQNCPDLETVVIGNQCNTIYESAFQDCLSLETVRLGKSVKTISALSFSGCTELSSMKLGGNETSIGGFAFANCKKLQRLDLPLTIRTIGIGAFMGCAVLESIDIPEGVNCMQQDVFNDCKNLQTVGIPASITAVFKGAFENCKRLKQITFGDALTSIGNNAFNACDSLNCVRIGSGIESLGDKSFANCLFLSDLYIGAVTPPTCTSKTFSGTETQWTTLYVPDESRSKYAAVSPWKTFIQKNLSQAPVFVSSIVLDPDVLVLNEDGFAQIQATVFPDDATNSNVYWSSSNTNVVYVANNGNVMANGEGIATITCTASDNNGARAICTVIVSNNHVMLNSLTLDKTEVTLIEGDEVDLTASFAPSNASYPELRWISSDERIAQVSSIGRVTALRKGNCTITCKANDGSGLFQECQLTVQEPVYASLATVGDVTGDGVVLQSDLEALMYLLLGRTESGVDVSMADVNRDGHVSIADVVKVISAIKDGTEVPVGQILILELESDHYEINISDSLQLIPLIIPYRAGVNLQWSSSNRNIATVDQQGYVRGISPGSVTIKAEATDDSGMQLECQVKVVGVSAWIDLGLPSGTLWATTDIGASVPEEMGYQLAWGEIQEHESGSYTWGDYSWCDGTDHSMNKYCIHENCGIVDGKDHLDLEDDAAYRLCGNNWRMPTQTQLSELMNKEYTKQELIEYNGVKGVLVTSISNGNSIFMPGTFYASQDLSDYGSMYSYVLRLTRLGSTVFPTISNNLQLRCNASSVRPVFVPTDEDDEMTPKVNIHLGHEYVDLGIEVNGNSVYWATCNVGADNPMELGDCFAWGETEVKSVYDWSTYKWCNGSLTTLTKYCTNSDYGSVDNKTELDPEDDAAVQNWGGQWRMPTGEEFQALYNQCSRKIIEQNGNVYMKFSNKNDETKFIRLPLGKEFEQVYWTSSLRLPKHNGQSGSACCFNEENYGTIYALRYLGFHIRPVLSGEQ